MRFFTKLVRSIQWKMVFLYVLMTVVVMEVVSIYLVTEIEKTFINNLELDLRGYTNNIASVIGESEALGNSIDLLTAMNDKDLQDYVVDEANAEIPQKEFILLFNEDYRIVPLDTDIAPVASAINPRYWVDIVLVELGEMGREYSAHIKEQKDSEERYQLVGVPIQRGSKTIGFVYVGASLTKQVDPQIDQIKRILFMGTMITVAITVILGLALARNIAKPITDLTRKAAEMAKGDFAQQIDVKSDDEIGQLGTMFNSLARQLDRTLGEISNEKSKIEAIFTYMSNGVIAFDDDGNLIHVNPKAKELLALADDKEDDHLKSKILTKLKVDSVDDIKQVKHPVSEEVAFNYPTKSVIRVQYAPFQRGDKLAGVIVVLQDITEQDRLEQMRRDFVANVSHELKTPLTNIKIRTQTLLDYYNDDFDMSQLLSMITAGWRMLGVSSQQVQYLLPDGADSVYDLTYSQLQDLLKWQSRQVHMKILPVIESEADRMNRLVRDLLLLSQLDSHRLQQDPEPFSIQHLLNQVAERMQSAAQEKGLSLQCSLDDDVTPIYGDGDKIEQVAVNIVSNAIKYTPAGGRVTITLQQQDDEAQICVADTGMGIPPEDLPRIFERFYRVDKARSRQFGGTGLGLSIAKQIVEAHGGTISITSELEKGTSVCFTIPVNEKEEE